MPDDTRSGATTATDADVGAATGAETGSNGGIDLGRLGRTLLLIGVVTAVFMILTANRFTGVVVQIGVVAIGAVALVTAIVGFLIAAGSMYQE